MSDSGTRDPGPGERTVKLACEKVWKIFGAGAEAFLAARSGKVDDAQLANKNSWTQSSSKSPFVDYGYRHDGNTHKGELSATFLAKLPKSGRYEVLLSYSIDANRATNVPVTIKHAAGETKVVVNQKKRPEIDGLFHSLGTYSFDADQSALVVVSNDKTNGYVIIDAVQWLPRSLKE